MPMTNEGRAAQAHGALIAYCEIKEGRAELYDDEQECIKDLIADLCHLLRRDYGFDDLMPVLATAHGHFEAELADEETPTK